MPALVPGNFDGMHRGHFALVAEAKRHAAQAGLPLLAVTFEPHPRRYFAPESPPFRLTSPAQKQALLLEAGADSVRALRFDASLAAVSAEDFARRILREECGAQIIVAGEDFRFGRDRMGDMTRMAEWMPGITIVPVPLLHDAAGQRYAASRARALLQDGVAQAAAAILGRPYIVCGMVEAGDRRGRQLGFPTANIDLGDYLRPRYGVYAARGRRADGGDWLEGVVNIGCRPTMGGEREWLELHLFDFAADIYGETWEVALVDFLRPERKFDGIDALTAQIGRDCAAAKQRLL